MWSRPSEVVDSPLDWIRNCFRVFALGPRYAPWRLRVGPNHWFYWFVVVDSRSSVNNNWVYWEFGCKTNIFQFQTRCTQPSGMDKNMRVRNNNEMFMYKNIIKRNFLFSDIKSVNLIRFLLLLMNFFVQYGCVFGDITQRFTQWTLILDNL